MDETTTVTNFNKIILQLVKFMKKKEPNNIDIEWLHKILCTIKNENPSLIIDKCMDKLWDMKDNIINRSEKFFLENDIEKKWIKDDCRKEWLTSFVQHIKQNMFILTDSEKGFIWNNLNKMLEIIIEHRILNKYYK